MSSPLEFDSSGLIGERLVRGHGWWPRQVCRLRGHDIEIVYRVPIALPKPESEPPPEPRCGVVFIEQQQIHHWISAIELLYLRCNRCHGEWKRQEKVEHGPPIRRSIWMAMEVSGRVIPPREDDEG